MTKKTNKKLPEGGAFLTGSRVYGEPHKDSDVDLVVLVSASDLKKLRPLSDTEGDEETANYIAAGGIPLRFGSLNLICCCDAKMYLIWRRGTAALKKRSRQTGRPITRDRAVKYLRRRRKAAGFHV